MGDNIKLLYKSVGLLLNIIRPKHKGSYKKLDINVVVFENNITKQRLRWDIQDDNPSI